MKKYFKIAILTFLVVGLMSGSAFAAAALNAGNTSVAAEKIGAGAYATAGFQSAYQTGGPIGATEVLKLSFGNATINGAHAIGAVKMCNGATLVGANTVATAGGDTSVNITLTAPLSTGVVYNFAAPGACAAASNPFTLVSIAGGTADGGQATLTVDSVTSPGNVNVYAQAPIFTVRNQFTATLLPVTSRLDFATGRKTFVADAAAQGTPRTPSVTQSQAALRIVSDETIQDKIVVAAGGGACTRVLAGGEIINARIAGDFTGLASVGLYIDATGDGAAATDTVAITAAMRTAGVVTLPLTNVGVEYCYSSDVPGAAVAPYQYKRLQLVATGAAGTSAIATGARTITLSLTAAGAFANTRALIAAGTTSHTFAYNGTVYYLPLGRSDATRSTYVKLQSKSVTTGSNGVSVQVLCGNGTMATFTPGEAFAIGTKHTITVYGTEMAAACAATSPVSADGFAAIITVNAPEADVFGYANILDATGSKRIPLKTVNGAIVE
jgi:hypothetical protein